MASHGVPEGSRVSEALQGVSGGCKGFQNGLRKFSEFSEHFKGFQEVSGVSVDFKSVSEIPKVFRGYYEVSEVFQDISGAFDGISEGSREF